MENEKLFDGKRILTDADSPVDPQKQKPLIETPPDGNPQKPLLPEPPDNRKLLNG